MGWWLLGLLLILIVLVIVSVNFQNRQMFWLSLAFPGLCQRKVGVVLCTTLVLYENCKWSDCQRELTPSWFALRVEASIEMLWNARELINELAQGETRERKELAITTLATPPVMRRLGRELHKPIVDGSLLSFRFTDQEKSAICHWTLCQLFNSFSVQQAITVVYCHWGFRWNWLVSKSKRKPKCYFKSAVYTKASSRGHFFVQLPSVCLICVLPQFDNI